MKNYRIIILSGLLTVMTVMLYPLTSYATTYKWVDGNNKTHYSNIKPDTSNFETLKPTPGPSSSAPAEIQNFKNEQKTIANQGQKNKLDQEKTNREKQAADILAQNCDVAKNKLATLTYTPRIRQLNPQSGEFEVLSPESLQRAILKARQDVEKFCGPKLPS